jgi:hypothetical protein
MDQVLYNNCWWSFVFKNSWWPFSLVNTGPGIPLMAMPCHLHCDPQTIFHNNGLFTEVLVANTTFSWLICNWSCAPQLDWKNQVFLLALEGLYVELEVNVYRVWKANINSCEQVTCVVHPLCNLTLPIPRSHETRMSFSAINTLSWLGGVIQTSSEYLFSFSFDQSLIVWNAPTSSL